MKNSISVLASLILLSHQSIALARPDGPGGRRNPIEELDIDKDSQLSKAEVANHPFFLDKFDEIDSNKDSQLSAEELKAHRESHRPPHHPAASNTAE